MSYADVAAKGPKQSPEELTPPLHYSKAAPVPTIEHSESEETASLIDVDSPHVSSVKSDFEDQKVKTQTQATRLEHEAEDKARAASKKAQELGKEAKQKAESAAKEAKKELKKDGKKLSDNRDNPVVIGNAVIWGITAIVLGVGAYKKQQEGKLDWKLAGTVAGCVGVFGVADYFGSQWLLENKYPPK